MKKILAAMTAVSALALAAPVAAQGYEGRGDDRGYDYDHRRDAGDDRGGYGYERPGYEYGPGGRGGDVREQIRRLDDRIDRAFQRGQINRREFERLQWQVNELNRLHRTYWRNDGRLNRWETTDLERRVERVRQQLRFDRYDDRRDGYGPRDRY